MLLHAPGDAAATKESEAAVDEMKQGGLWSTSLLVDILSDRTSVQSMLHRLQNLFFTLAFLLVYLYRAWQEAALPDFSDQQLALLGISGGTYIGFKIAAKPA